MIRNISKPIFSGHESFVCKSHWLKRGYDFVNAGNNFNDDEAVVHLGVGKNMVASIRFWLKNRHKAQRKAKFYINKCRSASCMQSGWKRTSA